MKRIIACLIILGMLLFTAGCFDKPTTCKDGSSSSATGRGACSGHGGVRAKPSE